MDLINLVWNIFEFFLLVGVWIGSLLFVLFIIYCLYEIIFGGLFKK